MLQPFASYWLPAAEIKGVRTDGKAVAEKDYVFVSGALLIPGDGSPPIEEATMIIENGVITKRRQEEGVFCAERRPSTWSSRARRSHRSWSTFTRIRDWATRRSFGAKNYKRESLSADLNRYGYYGVGAVLAGGDSDGLAFQLRDELREGKTTGAQLYTSGRGIAAKGSSGVMADIPVLISNAADARKAVAELADRQRGCDRPLG